VYEELGVQLNRQREMEATGGTFRDLRIESRCIRRRRFSRASGPLGWNPAVNYIPQPAEAKKGSTWAVDRIGASVPA
jgi:hypothetical protein